MKFEELNDDQKEQVHYLFADDVFQMDPNAYLYELDKHGKVTGRTPIKIERTTHRARQSPSIKITARKETNPTDKMISHARMNMDALAASIAQKLFEDESAAATEEGTQNDEDDTGQET
ncbi:MAG: hypothetical protein QY332_14655 [Anaerolineales bacterium]|nr:MAG: hypothetical protein QY332_14655 [Anaerolineales bacterium]